MAAARIAAFRNRTRHLKPGTVSLAAGVTVVLAALRLADVFVPNWWFVTIPAVVLPCVYLQVRVDHWADARRVQRCADCGAEYDHGAGQWRETGEER